MTKHVTIKQPQVSEFLPGIAFFDGITRKIIISEFKKMDINVKEAKVTIEDLLTYANEAFLTSALLEAMPLVECDGKAISNGKPGSITLKALEQYKNLIS